MARSFEELLTPLQRAQRDVIRAAVAFIEHPGAEVMVNCECYQWLVEVVKRWKEAQA